jgi:lysophospholipase L1-like esterase
MKKNARNYPVLIALGTIAGLYALSLAPVDQYRILGFDLKGVPFSLNYARMAALAPRPAAPAPPFSVVPEDQDEPDPVPTAVNGSPGRVVTAQTSTVAKLLSSALALPTVPNTGALPPPLIVDYGNSMQYYYQALGDFRPHDPAAGMIRIAYVGDSQIEGDVITKDLRALLQARYGGAGTGFMKIIAEDAGFRTDIRHTFSGDWTVEALNRNNAESEFWFGPVFISAKGSWVSYDITGKGSAGTDCYLLYRGDGTPHRIEVRANDGAVTMTGLDPAVGMHFLKIYYRGNAPLKTIGITFLDKGVRAYGVSFQADTGVYVDNYSLRGHSGLELARVSSEIASQVRQKSPYKLIILQFGVNVAYPQSVGFRLYERGIGNVIGHIKGLFPESGILVVSTPDRCVKEGEAILSDPGVTELLEAQQRAAEKEGVAFFDLYHAMGGTGAMTEWVKEGYAVRDYVHISRRGGKKIAMMLSLLLLDRGAL